MNTKMKIKINTDDRNDTDDSNKTNNINSNNKIIISILITSTTVTIQLIHIMIINIRNKHMLLYCCFDYYVIR